MQCIPIPESKHEFVEMYTKHVEATYACTTKYPNTDSYAFYKCYYNALRILYNYVGKNVYAHRAEYRCADYSLVPYLDESSSSSSSPSSSSVVPPASSAGSESGVVPPVVVPTKYVEIIFGREGVTEGEVKRITDAYAQKGSVVKVVVAGDKKDVTVAAVEFKNVEMAKDFVEAVTEGSGSMLDDITGVNYIDEMPSGASALVPSIFAFFALKLFF